MLRERRTTMQNATDQTEESEIDRILGHRLLFDLNEPRRYGGPSVPTLYRRRKEGLIEFAKSGGRSKLNRATMKAILGKGVALTST
jgi:hypothetical protein